MNRETLIAQMKEEQRQEDKKTAAMLLRDIPYFHKLYAKYHDPSFLEIAKNEGIILDKLYKKYEQPTQET